MDVRDKIIEVIENGAAYVGERKIFAELKIAPAEKKAVKKLLRTLDKEGEILACSSGYTTPKKLGAVRGIIRVSTRGFGFVTPKNSEIYHDFYIQKTALGGAYDGDEVLILPIKGTVDEAKVLRVLERNFKRTVGVFKKINNMGRITPDNPRLPEVCVPLSLSRGAKTGDKVVAAVTSYPKGGVPFAKVIEILGRDGDFLTDELAIIKAYGLKEWFSPSTENEALEAIKNFSFDGRRDLSGLSVFTIDGEDTRDMDDAVSLERAGENFVLGVHIADVSEYVRLLRRIDDEAYARGTSVYFPDRTLHMLPLSLSNGACSLAEGEKRATISVFLTFSPDGRRLDYKIEKTAICSRHKTTYAEISALLDGDNELREKYADIAPALFDMRTLCLALEKRAKESGAVDLDLRETKIILDGDKIFIPDCERTISERIIEQFMIAANCAVAEFLNEKKLPCLYRVHEKPSPEKCENLAYFLSGLGLTPSFDFENVKPKDFSNILSECAGREFAPVAAKVMLRSMQKAAYSPKNVGHFGLALKDYCHFTSPIRRYPDLFVHRVLSAALAGDYDKAKSYEKFAEENAKHLSACERRADEAEREVDKLYILKYMSDKLGEEFDAVVSGVTSFGVFCELKNNVEGLIPIEDLPTDGYELDESKYSLAGRKHAFRLGDGIRIKVAACDFGLRRVLFNLA